MDVLGVGAAVGAFDGTGVAAAGFDGLEVAGTVAAGTTVTLS